jgi:RNA polymerase sigma-70 factor, ECF subfamily
MGWSRLNKNMDITIDIDKEFLTIQSRLKSYLYRLSANKHDTEDLLHDTFVKVKEKIGTFKGKSSFKTWVFAIATNLAKDNRRIKNRWDMDAQDKCKEATMNSRECENSIISSFHSQTIKQFEIVEHINYCFTCIAKNLTLEQQITIILKEIYHFKSVEIAEIIEKTESIVKHHLYDARKELQTKYQQRCAMINKEGICYQCAELNDYLQQNPDSQQKIENLGLSENNNEKTNLDIRFSLINKINPLESNGASVEDTILQILREAIGDK